MFAMTTRNNGARQKKAAPRPGLQVPGFRITNAKLAEAFERARLAQLVPSDKTALALVAIAYFLKAHGFYKPEE
jgi:hypothetical protein